MPTLRFFSAFLVFFVTSLSQASANTAESKPDVLVIVVDDLRPELGCYGESRMQTPSIDALAASGMRFNRAYTAQAVCLPSRVSFLTGMRPDSTGVHDIWTDFRETIPNAVTMPQWFVQHGYRTVGMGKVFHTEKPKEWTEWVTFPDAKDYLSDEVLETIRKAEAEATASGLIGQERRRAMKGPAWEIVPDNRAGGLHDTVMTDRAIEEIKACRDQPLLMTVGFKRPHLPFVAPKRFWDLYPAEKIQLPANYRLGAPTAPAIALVDWGELRAYRGIPESGPVSDEEAIILNRGYRASVSYVDHEIGRLLAALHESRRDRNTIVVLWGDHGFKLGEHGMWTKHTNFENDTRVPLLIRAPGVTIAGSWSTAPVELIEVLPTLCELAGLQVPAQVEGRSLKAILSGTAPADWPTFARSQFKRDRKTGGDIIGYSMRTADHRYTEWRNVVSGALVATELYDHRVDEPEDHNLAADPTTAGLRAELSNLLCASHGTRAKTSTAK